MQFTLDELQEIEKVFDMWAGQQAMYMSTIIKNSLVKGPESERFHKIMLDEAIASHDVWRTISAKASKMRGEGGGSR